MLKNKLLAQADWTEMIEKSWTWAKLTNDEKFRFKEEISKSITQKEIIKGTYKQRWQVLNALYSMFLEGCGYNGCTWRENN